jgi:heme exporter protein C
MNWTWFHRLASPKWFFQLSGRLLPWLAVPSVLIMLVGLVWALAFAPEDYQQGNSFRIFYIHVPSAILAQSAFYLMAVAAVITLVWRIKLADSLIKVVAPIGASMTLLALVTGAVWGKPTWGTWWVWDARLTSTLVHFFIYLGIIAIYSAFQSRTTAGRAAAITTLVGVVNLPIIKFSVDWWNTLHQPASFTLTERPAMPVEMWLPALVMVAAFYGLFAVLVLVRLRTEILATEYRSDWVRAYWEQRNVF